MKITYTEDEIQKAAKKITAAATSKTLCLYGAMGAGKTTLIRAIVKHLGGAHSASSPTFGIVNEYETVAGETLGFHFDFYRLEDETEALDLGFEDYINQNVWVFIEWPDKIKSFLPEDTFNIHIEPQNDDTTRTLSYQVRSNE